MLVGQAGDKKTPAPVPAAPVAAASSCCDPCGSDGWGHRMRGRLGGLFNRNNCDSCQPTTCNDHGHGHRNDCCKPKFWNWQPACRESCHAAPTCTDSCCGSSHGLLTKLRDRFSRNDCCDGGCNGAVTTVPAKAGEKIDAPKKMPDSPPPKKVNTEVQLNTPPAPVATPTRIQGIPTAPAVEVTPIPVPRVEGDRRDPF
jgi:hypothetical protein